MRSNVWKRVWHFLRCAESRKFIRLKRFDRFARQTRCASFCLPFPVPLVSLYLSVTSRFCVFPLPISHSTSFISRNQSCAWRCNRIGKFLNRDGRTRHRRKRMKTNDLTRPHSRKTRWKTWQYQPGKTRFIRCKTRYAAPDAFRGGRSASSDSLHGFSRSVGGTAVYIALLSRGHIDLGVSTLQAMNSEKLVGVQ